MQCAKNNHESEASRCSTHGFIIVVKVGPISTHHSNEFATFCTLELRDQLKIQPNKDCKNSIVVEVRTLQLPTR